MKKILRKQKFCKKIPSNAFKFLQSSFLLTALLFISSNVFSQNTTISGLVKDDKGEPLAGVSVVVKGGSAGTNTNEAGKFSIAAPAKSTLIFSNIGFGNKEVDVNGQSFIDVQLTSSSASLNEVVIVSYGTQSKRKVTGSIQTLDTKEIADIPVAQFSQKLQGKLAGVQILQNTGQPGQGISIRIRGQASISAGNQPLYVVDGFPIVGDINNINPDEIESFSILKDASATSLYGSRAANGVVLITTKHAKAGQTSLNVNAYYGTQKVPQKGRPDLMNGPEFFQFEKEVFEERLAFQGSLSPGDQANYDYYHKPYESYNFGNGTDWYDALLRSAPIQDYSISLSSSKDKFSTSLIAGYFNQDGVIINSNFKRYSIRLNSEYKLNDKLKFGFNAAPTYTTNSTPNSDGVLWAGGIIQNAILSSPLSPAVDADGKLPLTSTGPGLFPNPNWYRIANEVTNDNTVSRILSNGYGELEIIKDLKFRSSVNVDWGSSLYKRWFPSTAGGIFDPPPHASGNATQNRYNYYSWLTENTLTYKVSFGKHNLDALAGYTAQKFHSDYNSIYAYNFPDDKIHTVNAGANQQAVSDLQEWTLLSYVGRLNYDYNGKYLLSAAIRRDGSSRFGSNNRYGNFPSVSVGWILSEENFMKNIPFISDLKIRASYGLIGNNNIGNYTYAAAVNTTNYVFNGVLAPGKSVTSLANNDLGWEKTKQLDIGLDASILKGRISFTYDYYKKTTSNLLYSVDVPLASGFSNIITNIGEFKFWGHEFTISTQNLVNRFRWNTDLNISFNKNKVVKLGTENASIFGEFTITKVDEPIGQFYGYVFDGIYKDQADFDKSPKHADSDVGTVKMKDVNGDGVIDADDQTVIGNPNPEYIFGITNSFFYKNFDLSVVAAGSVGNDIINATLAYTQNLDGVFNVTKNVARRWRSPASPGDGIHPRVVVGTPLARFTNSRWVSDGSYLTIKNITLGYTIPLKNNKYFFRSARVYTSVQQAFVFTKYDGANPEVSNSGSNPLNQGVDFTAYPVPRTFTFGLNVGF